MSIVSDEIRTAVEEGLQKPTIYLLPLRLFIGLGWMRACAEKLSEPGWYNGSSLTAFLQGHLHDGLVAFPFYQALMHQVFLPHAALLGKIIILGQLLAGIAILTGTLTTAALLGGLFMNLNFLLTGAISPSAFYLVIQAALLLTNSGSVLGVDWWLARHIREPRRSRRTLPAYRRQQTRRGFLLGLGVGFLALAAYALYWVNDFSPAGSVEDPAMLLMILAIMGAMWSVIAYRRAQTEAPAQRATR
jgi:thiosulfate dehydrogenase [quinone] large subunit